MLQDMKDKDFRILQKTNAVFLLIKTLEDIFKLNFILKNNLPAWRIIQIGVLVIFSFLKILIMRSFLIDTKDLFYFLSSVT